LPQVETDEMDRSKYHFFLPYSLIPYSLFPNSLFPIPYSLFPIPYSQLIGGFRLNPFRFLQGQGFILGVALDPILGNGVAFVFRGHLRH